MVSKVETGRASESLAESYLLAEGGRVLLTRNYRCKAGEVDLILEEANGRGSCELVFVEVRSRYEGSWLNGIESVDARKRRRLGQTIRHFLVGYRGRAQTLRFDILAWDGNAWVHLKNAWLQS